MRIIIGVCVVFIIFLAVRYAVMPKEPDSIDQAESCNRLNILSFEWIRGDLEITARNISGASRAAHLMALYYDKNDQELGKNALHGPVRSNNATAIMVDKNVPHGTVKVVVECLPDQ